LNRNSNGGDFDIIGEKMYINWSKTKGTLNIGTDLDADGFDLYYSLFTDGTWSVPVNFSEEINSAYDEYRPVTIHNDAFANNLMIFSSNRPGGKGGFDLYHVGIAQMIR
jgi:hypothetical protein